MLPGDQYIVKAYSHCNGFVNKNIVYIGTPPERCCPSKGELRHLYDMSYMLFEKCQEKALRNNYVGRWIVPQYKWLMDFQTRDVAIAFCEKYGIMDFRC